MTASQPIPFAFRAAVRFLLIAACLLGPAANPPLHAQTASSAPTTATPLAWQQLEATYQNELKKIHVPLLSTYVNDLQRLAATSSNAELTVAIEKELQYVQGVISRGGVIDLNSLAEDLRKGSTTPPATAPTPRQATNALLVLTPVQATTVTPPAPASPSGIGDSIAFTTITWNIEALPKGAYDLIAQCCLTALPTPGDLEVSLDRLPLLFPLEKRHLAPAPDSFRLIRLGTIELPLDIKNTTLTLTAPKDCQIQLRQLLITQAKSPPPNTPALPPQN